MRIFDLTFGGWRYALRVWTTEIIVRSWRRGVSVVASIVRAGRIL